MITNKVTENLATAKAFGGVSADGFEAEICAIQSRAQPTIYLLDSQGNVALISGTGGLHPASMPADIEPIARQLARRQDQSAHMFLSAAGEYVVQVTPFEGVLGSYTLVMLTAFKPRGDIRAKARAHGLTRRETDIVQLLSKGESTLQIAEALGIATTTVLQYIKTALAKTSTHSRLELLAKLSRNFP